MSTIKLSWGIGVVVRGLLLTMAQVWWGALPGKDAGPAVLLRCKVVLRNYMGWKKAWGNKKKKINLENPALFTNNLQTGKEVKFIKEMNRYKLFVQLL